MNKSGGFFDLPAKEARLKELDVLSQSSGFWSDNTQAKKILQEREMLQRVFNEHTQRTRLLDDLNAHIELAVEAKDESEAAEASRQIEKLEKMLREAALQIKLSDPHDHAGAIVNLHGGTGGTEAMDWAEMLLRMYSRWCERKGYELFITDILAGEEAGVKSVTFIARGPYAYGYMKGEVGVHRLVRISPFDSNKRRHTSFASVDVIPEIEDDVDIKIEEKDLRVDTYRAGGHGGQHVNKTDSAVRITHIPTNAVVQCQNERSQHKNRAMCMKLLKAKLYELDQEKKRAALEKHYDDKGQISWGSQIRSYVFMPYQMVKDLRTGYETGKIQDVMDGDLDPFVEAYLSWKAGGAKTTARN